MFLWLVECCQADDSQYTESDKDELQQNRSVLKAKGKQKKKIARIQWRAQNLSTICTPTDAAVWHPHKAPSHLCRTPTEVLPPARPVATLDAQGISSWHSSWKRLSLGLMRHVWVHACPGTPTRCRTSCSTLPSDPQRKKRHETNTRRPLFHRAQHGAAEIRKLSASPERHLPIA